MRVRDSEILLPTTMVGSYPRPPWLTGKVFGEFDEPDYIDYGTKERFWDAVQICVDDQVRAGLDVICDGQQYFESETMHEYGQVFHFWGHHLKGFTRWGDEAMRRAAEIGRALDLPLYIHFGQLWPLPEDKHPYDPDAILPDMLKILRPGDILAHPFTRHPGGFVDQHGKVHPVVREALAQGLKTDVGHGSHFSFKMARLVLEAGIVPDTLGADMHGYNTTIPKPRGTPETHPDNEEMHLFAGAQNFSLASAMTSMLALGLSLEQVVPMVTSNCAAMLGMTDEIGTLRPGVEADLSVLADESGRFVLKDNEDTQVVAEHFIRPVFCLRAGKRFDADSVILPEPMLADAA